MGEEVIIRVFAKTAIKGNYYLTSNSHVKGAILIGCAMGITQKYYQHMAIFFCERGFNVLTFDFRGTGLSSPKNLRNCSADLMDWADDISYSLEYLKLKNENSRLFFIGHSIASQLFGFARNNKLVDKTIFLASSTGYWKDSDSMVKWKNLLLLSVIMPISIAVWGYTNARFFKQGENYPKGASLQWRRWCLNPQYLGIELDGFKDFFDRYSNQIYSYWFTDDSIANEFSAKKLLVFYKKASTTLFKISPTDCNQAKIGHSGFLSRKFRDSLWSDMADLLSK